MKEDLLEKYQNAQWKKYDFPESFKELKVFNYNDLKRLSAEDYRIWFEEYLEKDYLPCYLKVISMELANTEVIKMPGDNNAIANNNIRYISKEKYLKVLLHPIKCEVKEFEDNGNTSFAVSYNNGTNPHLYTIDKDVFVMEYFYDDGLHGDTHKTDIIRIDDIFNWDTEKGDIQLYVLKDSYVYGLLYAYHNHLF